MCCFGGSLTGLVRNNALGLLTGLGTGYLLAVRTHVIAPLIPVVSLLAFWCIAITSWATIIAAAPTPLAIEAAQLDGVGVRLVVAFARQVNLARQKDRLGKTRC